MAAPQCPAKAVISLLCPRITVQQEARQQNLMREALAPLFADSWTQSLDCIPSTCTHTLHMHAHTPCMHAHTHRDRLPHLCSDLQGEACYLLKYFPEPNSQKHPRISRKSGGLDLGGSGREITEKKASCTFLSLRQTKR